MDAKESTGGNLTQVESILVLSRIGNDSIAQTAKRIEDYIEAKSKEEAWERWISVEDRLPDREHPDEALPVLVSCGGQGPVYEAVYEGKGGFYRSIYEDYPEVTHWMPLPEPPLAAFGKEGEG